MQKRQTVLISSLLLLLMVGFFLSPAPAVAFTKVTPTPDANDNTQPVPEDVDVEALLEDAIGQLDAGNYSDAIQTLDTIISIDETVWDAYFFRAFAYSETGDVDRAIDDYTRAIDIRPYDWTGYTLRGNLYVQIGDLEQADLDYDQAIYLNPRFPDAYLGKALLNSQRNDQTLTQIFEGILAALRASSSGSARSSIDILTEVIGLVDDGSAPPALGYVYYNRANAYIGQGNWQRALDDMNQAIDLQPFMQDYYMARGFIYSETDELALAAPDFYERMTLVEINSINGTLDFGQTVPVDMDYGTVARLTFSGEAGQTITITARDSLGVGVDPLLILLDTDGNPLVGNDDGGGEFDSLINNYQLPTSGTYTAVVSHANGGYVGTVNVSLK